MKIRHILLPLVILVLIAMTLSANAEGATNAPALTLPDGIDQVVGLLGPNAKVIAVKVAAWMAALSIILAFVRKGVDHWFRDRMNAAAIANGGGDTWLRSIYGAAWYRTIATLLAFVSISLPSVSDLDRATKLQREAVSDALDKNSNPTPTGG